MEMMMISATLTVKVIDLAAVMVVIMIVMMTMMMTVMVLIWQQ